jgi:hypothetical protein
MGNEGHSMCILNLEILENENVTKGKTLKDEIWRIYRQISTFYTNIDIFCWDWGLNLGLCTYKAGTLPHLK